MILDNTTDTITPDVNGTISIGGYLIPYTSATISAAGTNQASATVIANEVNIVTSVAAGTGVVLPTPTALGQRILIVNNGTNSLLVYPISGGTIEALGANNPKTQGVSETVEYTAVTTTGWSITNDTFGAGIPNTALSNSSVTIGTTAISLGSTSTSLAGLVSVTSTTFVGSLTGPSSQSAVTVTGSSNNYLMPFLNTITNGTGNIALLMGNANNFTYNPSSYVLSVGGVSVSNTTASTSSTTGALIVSGGVGIAGSLNVGGYVYPSIAASVTATGTTQGTAAAITTEHVIVTAGAANTGVILPTAIVGMKLIIVNKSSGAGAILVYPATGAAIDANGTNVGVSVAYGASLTVIADTTTQWYSVSTGSTGGVTSVTGTTGQITASPTTGAVVLSLPSTITEALTFSAGVASTSVGTGTIIITGGESISGNSFIGGNTILSNQMGVTATGTTQGTALALTADNVIVTSAAAGSGVVLPTPYVGQDVTIINWGANPVNIYPAVGGQLDALGVNTPYSLPVGATAVYLAQTTTLWRFQAKPQVNVALVSNNASYFLTMVASAGSANQNIDVVSNLSFNPSTNVLSTGSLTLSNTTASTSSTTGALTVAGGAGIAGSLFVGGYVYPSMAASVAAAGSTQGTATLITAEHVVVTSATAGTAFGVLLPVAITGMKLLIINKTAAAISVYPNTSAYIDSNAINAATTVPAGGALTVLADTTTQWYSASTGTATGTIRGVVSQTGTAGQTVITQSYTVGALDIHINGSLLSQSEYTATNGTSITLNRALIGGEEIQMFTYTASTLASALALTGGTVTGATTFNAGIASTSYSTGTLIITGGLGVSGAGYFNGLISTGTYYLDTVTTAITATGTTQGTAAALTSTTNQVTSVAAGAGVILPATPTTGTRNIIVFNDGANALLVYPPTGGVIDNAATNAAVSIPVNSQAEYSSTSSGKWETLRAPLTGTNGITSTPGNGSVTISLSSTLPQATTFSAGVASTSSTTGTVIVSGGIGVSGNANVGGIIQTSSYFVTTVSTGVTAAGTTYSTATVLTSDVNRVTSATAGSATGVMLPAVPATGSRRVAVFNDSTTVTINVYPPTGGVIDQAAANVPVQISPLQQAEYLTTAAGTYETLRTSTVGGTGITITPSSGITTIATTVPGRNKIINGDFVVDQHYFGASVTPAVTGNTYVLDRWVLGVSVASKLTSVVYINTSPSGGVPSENAIKITGPSASYSPAAADYFVLQQTIEGFNIRDLQLGTANAQPFTLSFWTFCTVAGTYGGCIRNAAGTESFPFSYALAASTWTKVTVNIPAITSGTWPVTSAASMLVDFCLGVGTTYAGTAGAWAAANYVGVTGQTNFVNNISANVYFTAVQLEAGTVASNFEVLTYQQTLTACKRYYCLVGNGLAGQSNSTTTFEAMEKFEVEMRAQPTGALISGRSTSIRYNGGDDVATTPVMANFSATVNGMWCQLTGWATAFSGSNIPLHSRNSGSYAAFIACNAEL